MVITLPLFIFIAIIATLPSILWLFSYLLKDVHPEPKQVILQLFLIGFILPIFVGYGESLLQYKTHPSFPLALQSPQTIAAVALILIAAFWEEVVKYIAARAIFHHEKEFDEMTDAMIYLITVALGFAASENIIIVLNALYEDPAQNIFVILGLRTLGANLLHTFASGILGYFIARGLFLKERFSFVKGLLSATAVHAMFNWLVLQASADQPYTTILLIVLLVIALLIILKDFDNLKRYDQ